MSHVAGDTKRQGPRFFAGWVGYRIPRIPEQPLDAEQLQGRKTYYAGYFDQRERLVLFEKYLDGQLEWTDQYEYWPNGVLKRHRLLRADGSTQVHEYDPTGKRIAPSIPVKE